MRWDIFCQVIDNHGDIGVCWRVARELAERGEHVRLWVDDPSALAWMAPQGHARVELVHWTAQAMREDCGDVVVEAFGCDPPARFIAHMARRTPRPVWLNLEYLSAESYVERSHGLLSPVQGGPGAGMSKRFHYPGFTQRTGGLLRERDLPARRAAFDRDAWLAARGVDPGRACISLFCYEPAALPELLRQLDAQPRPTALLVTAGRAADAVRACAWHPSHVAVHHLPLMSQPDYDHLLWSCALNFVRGEDSVVRALLAGIPFVWQLYPQADGAHGPKLEAFLHWLQAPAELARFHRRWNALDDAALPPIDLATWGEAARVARQQAFALPELTDTLVRAAGQRC